jgi:hypothetical protein
MKILFPVATLYLLQLAGCTNPKPAENPIDKALAAKPAPTQRFEGISAVGMQGVALDTVTGQWCKTWDWSYKNAAMSGGLDTLPTCLSIFQSTPTKTAFPWEKYQKVNP